MNQRLEAVARALCTLEQLDPDAKVATSDYTGGFHHGLGSDVAQWCTKTDEAARFLAMLDSATFSSSGEVHQARPLR